MILVIIHLVLLLYSVGNVRSFTPLSKRYILPKYSNLDVSENDNNGDEVYSDATNGVDQIKSINNTITPTIASKITTSSFPGNTVMAPVASLKKKISLRNKKGIVVDNIKDRKMDLMWCQSDRCQEVVRERVVGDHNTIIFNGPATGQVAYRWNQKAYPIDRVKSDPESSETSSSSKIASVLLLVKRGDEALLQIAAQKVPELTEVGIDVLMAPDLAAKLKHYYGVDDERISLFEQPKDPNRVDSRIRHVDDAEEEWVHDMNYVEPFPDLVVTLGGDGLLMYASSVFQGPIPPLLAISGGSLGFLTAFSKHEMTQAIKVALGMATPIEDNTDGTAQDVQFSSLEEKEQSSLQISPPNMPSYPSISDSAPRFTFGVEDYICMTIRMRLDCRIVNKEGIVRARYNVLNEVVIDRGSSPYLAALECFCDDVHLTTVQADGVIFAT
jgi:NAD kinase